MSEIITGMNEAFGPWLCTQVGIKWTAARGQTIAQVGAKGVEAVTLYEDFNGASVMMHIAASGKRWLNKRYLWMCFDYPFNQLKCRKVIGVVPRSNEASTNFVQHLGFVQEAVIADCHPKGDLVVWTMTRAQCKWLALGERFPELQKAA